MEWEDYIETRKAFDEVRVAQINAFDKATLTLSGSSIAFSITLLTFLGSRSGIELNFPSLVVVSWICFSSAIILNLGSYLSSARSYLKEIMNLDEAFGTKEYRPWEPDFFHRLTLYSNRLALVLMVCGMVSLFAFAYFNVTGGH